MWLIISHALSLYVQCKLYLKLYTHDPLLYQSCDSLVTGIAVLSITLSSCRQSNGVYKLGGDGGGDGGGGLVKEELNHSSGYRTTWRVGSNGDGEVYPLPYPNLSQNRILFMNLALLAFRPNFRPNMPQNAPFYTSTVIVFWLRTLAPILRVFLSFILYFLEETKGFFFVTMLI